MKTTLLLLTLAITGCMSSDDEVVTETESPLYRMICMNDYYSDSTYTTWVGYRGGFCGTNVTQYGLKTKYVIRTCETCD